MVVNPLTEREKLEYCPLKSGEQLLKDWREQCARRGVSPDTPLDHSFAFGWLSVKYDCLYYRLMLGDEFARP